MHKASVPKTPTHVPIRQTWLFCFRVCVLCLHVVMEKEHGRFVHRGGHLKNDVPKTPTLLQKMFSGIFHQSRPKNVTGRAWLNTESAADLHLVISQTCWLQKVPIPRDGRLRQVPLYIKKITRYIVCFLEILSLQINNKLNISSCDNSIYRYMESC